ncbi:MAG: twin-arginine translocase subunit TatC [Chloroflexi bacterium]|nr:twin-arginine translocase subunit TatC [Chloroflexota bacterium]
MSTYTDRELSIMEHLLELRTRLMWAVIALVIGTAIGTIFTERVLGLLTIPLGDNVPQAIAPTEAILVYFRIALILGVTIAMPVIVYEIILFLLPGLLPSERKYLTMLVPGAGVSFAAGVAFAVFVMMPGMVQFMQGFLTSIVENNWTLQNYINFVTFVMFWMGILFEMPLVIFFLAKLGVVSVAQLSKARRWAAMASALVAAIVTPTHDPVNMLVLMVPLVVLYEIGILLARFAKPKTDEAAETMIA